MPVVKKYFLKALKRVLPAGKYYEADILFRNRNGEDPEAPYFVSRKRSKEKYCIFRYTYPGMMVLSTAKRYIFDYQWAKRYGYIPVLDMEPQYTFQQRHIGELNMWDLVFDQQVSVREALTKDWVMVTNTSLHSTYLPDMCLDLNGKEDIFTVRTIEDDSWREYYKKVNSYMQEALPIKKEIWEEFDKSFGTEFEDGNRHLGVSLRETFSADCDERNRSTEAFRKVYEHHPRTISTRQILDVVEKYIGEHDIDKIFISTVYQESVELFKERFGDKIFFLDRQRDSLEDVISKGDKIKMPWHSPKDIYDLFREKKDFNRERTVSYMLEILALSKCRYGMFSKSSGSAMALAFNNGQYDDMMILPDLNNIEAY